MRFQRLPLARGGTVQRKIFNLANGGQLIHPGPSSSRSRFFMESATKLPRNNKVLKERPPPISDEEQRLNRRQRCTLSQLRSGHCHILQDYKYMVFGEPINICTNCGASPQDVRHLFARNKHPTESGEINSCIKLPRQREP